jgi:hypothetical protein
MRRSGVENKRKTRKVRPENMPSTTPKPASLHRRLLKKGHPAQKQKEQQETNTATIANRARGKTTPPVQPGGTKLSSPKTERNKTAGRREAKPPSPVERINKQGAL